MMRDGEEIPMVMSYDKTQYDDKSPFIFFTRGSQSSKEDLAFSEDKISLMKRGIVCAYPLTRGKLIRLNFHRN